MELSDEQKLKMRLLQVMLNDCNTKAILFSDAICKMSKPETCNSVLDELEIALSKATENCENEIKALENGFVLEQLMKKFSDMFGEGKDGE